MKGENPCTELVLIQLPRGRTALIGFDPAGSRVFTNHQGFFDSLLQRGVRNLEGRLLFSPDGREFLCAIYDALFVNGYDVHWMHAATGLDSPTNPMA